MNQIIIGSTAIKHFFPDFPREPKDMDYAVRSRQQSFKGTEYLYNPILFKYVNEEYCPPDILYTLKISHLFWDINWEKNMWDVQWLKEKGCKLQLNIFQCNRNNSKVL